MKCLRCGYCCIYLDVMIIKPDVVDKINNTDELSPDDVQHKPCNKKCPHLEFKEGIAVCKIHSKPWYDETPCYSHTQYGKCETTCRIGEGVKQGAINVDKDLEYAS